MKRSAEAIRAEIMYVERQMEMAFSFTQSARDRARIRDLYEELRQVEGAPESKLGPVPAPETEEERKARRAQQRKALGEAVECYFSRLRKREKKLKEVSKKRNEAYRQ